MIRNVLTLALLMLGLVSLAQADEKSICGQDDRLPSTNPKVARLQQPTAMAGCTVTMIGRACAITAGHCYSTFNIAEFNTPASVGGRITHSVKEDVYKVDTKTVNYVNGGQGNDYAVFRLKPNVYTKKLPGDVQGWYGVSFAFPKKGDHVRITGYGADRPDPTRNFAQQTHTGPIVKLDKARAIMNHRADTMGGNSGSSVIHEETGKVIAIHTHGGCYSSGGSNASTLIAARPKLQKLIKDCLAWERQNL